MTRFKKILSLFLILIFSLTLFNVSAMALPPSNPHITSGSSDDGGNFFEYKGSNGWYDLKTPPHWVVETGEVAYCLDHAADSPYGTAYSTFNPKSVYSNRTYIGLCAIIEHSFPYRNAGLTDQQIRYATANAIRSWLKESEGIGYDFMLPSNNAIRRKSAASQGVYNFYIQLLDKARNGYVIGQSIIISPDVIELELKDGTLQGTVTIEYSALNGKYTIDESKLSPGMAVSGYTGNSGDVLTFSIPIGLVGKTITLTDILIGYDNRCEANIIWLDDSGSKQAVAVPVVDTMRKVVKSSITLKSKPARLTITKMDSVTGNKLQGARFGIYVDDVLIEKISTDEDGEATSGNLVFRDYYVKELSAPEGYILSDEVYSFTIDNVGQQESVEFNNDPLKGKVSILKIGENNEPLQGVSFGIYDSSDTLIQEIITDEQGNALSDYLYYGHYYLKELEAIEGYVLDYESIPFNIVEDDEVVELEISNSLIRGQIRINVQDEEANPLEGASFNIYDSKDNLIEGIVTDEDGIALSSSLIYGKHYFEQTIAPEGYITDSSDYEFTIVNDGEVLDFNIVNRRITGAVEVRVTDSETGEALEGVEFEIYDDSDNVVGTITTDEGGYCKEGVLAYGDYYLKQVSVPVGYVQAEIEYAFSIVNDGEIVKLEIPIDSIKGKIEVLVIEPIDNNPVAGVKLGIFNETGEVLQEILTNSEGKAISSELRYGEYYIKEISVPTGYIIDDYMTVFDINEGGETIKIKVRITPVSGSVKVLFKDSDNGNEISDSFIYSDWSGRFFEDWLKEKGLDNMEINGYRFVEISNVEDRVIKDNQVVIISWYKSIESSEKNETLWNGAYIPKTGQALPKLDYFLGILCFIFAVLILGVSNCTVGGKRK